MIRVLYFHPDTELHTDLKVEDIPQALAEPKGLLWVDFQGNPPEVDEPILRDIFRFHPLAIDDALQESHVPKLDDWGEYLYIVLHTVLFNETWHESLTTLELDIFLGKNYVVTHHDKHLDAIERVWELLQRDERELQGGPDHLLYRLSDEVVASYMPAMERMDSAIDATEEEIFHRFPSNQTLENILDIKRAALRMQRILGPQREVLNKLARDSFPVIDSRARIYFRDVYDHLVRMHNIAESVRDLVTGSIEMYLSVVNNRMNEIMKTLTVITTLFMPISFITSYFGMNFFFPTGQSVEIAGMPAFMVVSALVLALPVGMFFWIRGRGWM